MTTIAQLTEELLKVNDTLLNAAKAGDLTAVQEALNDGADVNIEGDFGLTPLFHAVDGQHESMVQLLLDNKADPEMRTINNDTILHVAAGDGYARILELLIAAKANVNDLEGSMSPLSAAALNKHEDAVKILLNAGAKVEESSNYTPLHWAAAGGARKIIEMLLNAGADISAVTDNGETPLHFAAENKHEEGVEALLKGGADPNTPNKDGKTPLMLAKGKGSRETQALLREAMRHPEKYEQPLTTVSLAKAKGAIHTAAGTGRMGRM